MDCTSHRKKNKAFHSKNCHTVTCDEVVKRSDAVEVLAYRNSEAVCVIRDSEFGSEDVEWIDIDDLTSDLIEKNTRIVH